MTNPTEADKMVRRIQALMDKADSTEFGPERDALREKADALMVKFAIDQFQLDEARAARGESRAMVPVQMDLLIPMEPSQLAWYYSDLLNNITSVLGVRKLSRGYETDDNGTRCRRYTMVGYEMDVKYAQLLYLSLRMEMLKMLAPTADPSQSYDANVFTLHEAGIKWEAIARMMNKHVRSSEGDRAYDSIDWRRQMPSVGPWGFTPWPDGGRLKRAHKRECARRGVDHYAVFNARNYRDDFANGFTTRIAARLRGTRSDAGTALVLRKRQEDVDALWESLLPPPTPIPEPDPNAKPVKTRVAKVRYRSVDFGAIARGRQAADRVSLARPGTNVNQGSAGRLQ